MSWAKVVCVDASETNGLTVGTVYEVVNRYVRSHSSKKFGVDDHEMVLLLGVRNEGTLCGGWLARRFRPVVTKTIEQDVQMFKRIAETAPSLEDAE